MLKILFNLNSQKNEIKNPKKQWKKT